MGRVSVNENKIGVRNAFLTPNLAWSDPNSYTEIRRGFAERHRDFILMPTLDLLPGASRNTASFAIGVRLGISECKTFVPGSCKCKPANES